MPLCGRLRPLARSPARALVPPFGWRHSVRFCHGVRTCDAPSFTGEQPRVAHAGTPRKARRPLPRPPRPPTRPARPRIERGTPPGPRRRPRPAEPWMPALPPPGEPCGTAKVVPSRGPRCRPRQLLAMPPAPTRRTETSGRAAVRALADARSCRMVCASARLEPLIARLQAHAIATVRARSPAGVSYNRVSSQFAAVVEPIVAPALRPSRARSPRSGSNPAW